MPIFHQCNFGSNSVSRFRSSVFFGRFKFRTSVLVDEFKVQGVRKFARNKWKKLIFACFSVIKSLIFCAQLFSHKIAKKGII